MTTESCQNGIFDLQTVDHHLVGLINSYKILGVLSGKPWAEREHKIQESWNWLCAEKAKWWQPAKATGELVTAGNSQGTLSNLRDEILANIVAPQD